MPKLQSYPMLGLFGKKFTVAVDKASIIVELDKASIISAIAFVGAVCACFIISYGLLMLIRGHTAYTWARFKGIVLLVSGVGLLVVNLTAVLRNDFIVQRMTQLLEYMHI